MKNSHEHRINSIDSIENISFKDVSFSYDQSKEIIHDFNHVFYKNKNYVLVGNSGSGKSIDHQVTFKQL